MIPKNAPSLPGNPILVEVVRGTLVESVHRGAFAVVDAKGGVMHSTGDIERPVYPRSSIKPLQALPLIESGAAAHFGLDAEHLALACASHRGEPVHVEKVTRWLERAGLSERDLECGISRPMDERAQDALANAHQVPSQLHNNCSGKHTGFLCTAKFLEADTRGYISADHVVQRRVRQAVGEMADLDLSRAPAGRDGCGIPVIALPLRSIALSMARLADPSSLHDERRFAAGLLLDAMKTHPTLVDGTVGMTTAVMTAAGATVRLKPGAEGVFCAALPTLGLGVALKIDDGAVRAADLAMATLLERLGCFDEQQRVTLAPFLSPRLKTVAGLEAGSLRAVTTF